MKQITISRMTSIDNVSRDNWKDLISSLVLAGYEVCADEDNLVFNLGDYDKVSEIKRN